VKGSRATTIIVTVVITLAVLGGLGLVYMYSGAYNVAANHRPSKLEHWILVTTREHSVARRASDILTVPDLDDSVRLRKGLVHYRESCVDCHGVPGSGREEFAADMNPDPPRFFRTPEDLQRMEARRRAREQQAAGEGANGRPAAQEREDHEKAEARENFWTIKHGIGMTGMPAFGDDHSDDEIWDMVAVVNALRHGMTADQYQALVQSLPADSDQEHEHAHPGDGTEPGSSAQTHAEGGSGG